MRKLTNKLFLKELVSGEHLHVNCSALAELTGHHRNTVKNRVQKLFSKKILNLPVFPYFNLYNEYPVLVAVRADFTNTDKTQKWLKDDIQIFASYTSIDHNYNTLLFIFHKSVYHYQKWRENILSKGYLSHRDTRASSSRTFFASQLIRKYSPETGVLLLEEDFKKRQPLIINDFTFDDLSLKICKLLVEGKEGEIFRLNDTAIAKKLNLHRKTIKTWKERLIENKIVLSPRCRFPNFFTPPNYILVYSLIEFRGDKEKFIAYTHKDPKISLLLGTSEGRFNFTVFSVHRSIEEHFEWFSEYKNRFCESIYSCIGDVRNTYLSPAMAIEINQQKVSLGAIDKSIDELLGKKGNKKEEEEKPEFLFSIPKS